MDLIFALIVVASVVVWFRMLHEFWFLLDEWAMAEQVRTWRGLVRPYNNHLSILALGIYRLLLGIFGFSTHAPYRLVGLVCHASIPVAFHLTNRRRLGVPVSAAMALMLLWPRLLSLEPGGLNHSLAATGAIVCAYGLAGSSRRHDWFVAGGLAFSLAATGGGVAVVAAGLVHSLCRRSPWRRWLAVVAPLAAWITWRALAVAPEPEWVSRARPSLGRLLRMAAEHSVDSFTQLGLGNRGAGWVLLAGFAALAAMRLRRGLSAAAEHLAWSGALLVWWFGLAWSRWLFLDNSFRYQNFGAVMILLAVVPREPVVWPAPIRSRLQRVRRAAPAGITVLAAVVISTTLPDLHQFVDTMSTSGRDRHLDAVAINLPAAQIAGDEQLDVTLGNTDASAIRSLFRAWGPPAHDGDVDWLVRESVSVSLTRPGELSAPKGDCPFRGQTHRTKPAALVAVAAQDRPSTVEVRRFGSHWITAGTVPPGRTGLIGLDDRRSPVPWEIRVRNGCVMGGSDH